MRIFAFEGISYAPGAPRGAAQGSARDLGRLAAPPYDQLDDRRAAELHALDPHHFSRLTKPVPGEAGDLYQEAARLHRRWLEDGALVRSPEPALYPYTIELPDGGRRLGLTALVGLEEPESGVIRPHEKTMAKPLADRLALLRAMEVDLEPVLLLSEDEGELDRFLSEDLAEDRSGPLADHEDEAGNRHHLHRIVGSQRIARYRSCLGPAPAAIADGHHRYQVALQYARERNLLPAPGSSHDDPPPVAATKLAVITSLRSPALEIRPIHRALREDPGFTEAPHGVVARDTVAAGDGHEFAAAVAAADPPALGVAVRGRAPEIWRLDPDAAAGDLSPGARRLPVALLHGALLPGLGLPAETATDGTVRYRSDPGTLWEMVSSGDAEVGLFLPPMEPADFAAAIAGGEMLPPKSTRFLPKVVSGLVWADHGARLA